MQRRAVTMLVFFLLAGAQAIPAGATPGALDPSFSGDGAAFVSFSDGHGTLEAIARQTDGALVAVGSQADYISNAFAVVRLNADGSPDGTFGDIYGRVFTDFGVRSHAIDVAIQDDGKIVVAGTVGETNPRAIGVTRYLTDGSLDTSFSGDGIQTLSFAESGAVKALAVMPDGKIMVLGNDSGLIVLLRLKADGHFDPTFGVNGAMWITEYWGTYKTLTALADGGVLLGGSYGKSLAAARVTSTGALDLTFGGGDGIATARFGRNRATGHDLTLEASGNVVVVGDVSRRERDPEIAIARFDAAGAPDLPFGGGDGKRKIGGGAPFIGTDVAIDPSDNIVLAARYGRNSAVIRLLSDGELDPAFRSGIVNVTSEAEAFTDALVQPDGNIVICGTLSRGLWGGLVARLLGA